MKQTKIVLRNFMKQTKNVSRSNKTLARNITNKISELIQKRGKNDGLRLKLKKILEMRPGILLLGMPPTIYI